MKTCAYVYTRGVYIAECGSELIFRPTGRCDKCGRKVMERRKYVTGTNRPSK